MRRRLLRAGTVAGVLVAVAAVISVDIYPILTNDSLAYLSHSNSLREAGAVQVGYRLIGYPAFLAAIDSIASVLRYEPLLLSVVLQRLVLLSGLAMAAWLWRWRAVLLIAVALIPTFLVYTNFILTEGLGVGLAVWYGIAVAVVVTRTPALMDGGGTVRRKRLVVAAGSLALVLFLALVTIRFHYVLTGLGVAAVIVQLSWSRSTRRAGLVLGGILVVGGAAFLTLASLENADEYGTFFPAVRSERSQFWAVWTITFQDDPENQENASLSELFAGGSPYNVIREIDALPDYSDQQEAYRAAIKTLIDESGSTMMRERLASVLGVARGGRIDDVLGIVSDASLSNIDTVERMIYRNAVAAREGPRYVDDVYNEGRRIRPVITSPLAPWRGFPYFLPLYQLLLAASIIVVAGGLVVPSTRVLAVVGSGTFMVISVVFGYYMLDNVRFLLVPLVLVITIAAATADWGYRNSRILSRPGARM